MPKHRGKKEKIKEWIAKKKAESAAEYRWNKEYLSSFKRQIEKEN